MNWAWGRDLAVLAGLGAFLGHVFPVWLRFKGGKGVATYLGVLIGLSWPAAIAFTAVWLAVAALSRYSSLAALMASAATPAILWWGTHDRLEAQLFLALTLLLWAMHRANIMRLARGEEGKIGAAKDIPVVGDLPR
jgi:glycerol-3-phosphate acyltransferase PlsY